MARRIVNLIVDEGFFKTFEKRRQLEQMKLRKKLGANFNLSQRNFTAMLNARNFEFKIPRERRKKRK